MNYKDRIDRVERSIEESREAAEGAAEKLRAVGVQILAAARDELYFSMRFLDVALSSFGYEMDMSVSPFGTDGRTIWFHPQQLGGLLRENRILVNRGYLHMVFHCVFRHMQKPVQGRDTDEKGLEGRYWDLCCDIAVEHLIDGCDLRPVRFSRSLLRRETYRKLEAGDNVLNAERILRRLKEWELSEKELSALEEEFYVDDHRYWENHMPEKQPDPELNRKWKEIDEKMETDLETFSKEASEQSGDLLGELKVETRERHDYRDFLRKFSVFREEMGVDPDSFDYGFYSYGLSLYGNMPLIEPQETREVKKITDFVVVIDTSMSCSGELVRRFLEETYSVLKENDSFFRKVNIHIIQCDEKVHTDVKVTSREELDEYMEHFQLYGEGGTDFRPAFVHVEKLLCAGEFEDLKGLVYFTDGYGTYPEKMPAYRTAFVFLEEDYRDAEVPPWAIKLILREEDLQPAAF
ncbi:MAG TPA: metallopeptidase [Candidatus Mediterraneibacter intestinavium]|nr:metallopeptidase [Candidatus Mediterraneibacter intestinavium]